MAKEELNAAIDRVFAQLDSLSDEELFAALDEVRDGPLAGAIREAQEFSSGMLHSPLEVRLLQPSTTGWFGVIPLGYSDGDFRLDRVPESVSEWPVNSAYCENCDNIFYDTDATNDPYHSMVLAA